MLVSIPSDDCHCIVIVFPCHKIQSTTQRNSLFIGSYNVGHNRKEK